MPEEPQEMDWGSFALPKPEKRVKERKGLTTRKPLGSSPGEALRRKGARAISTHGKKTGNAFKDRSGAQEDFVAADLSERTKIPFRPVKGSGAFKEAGLVGDVETLPKVRQPGYSPTHRWLAELKAEGKKNARGEKQITFPLDVLKQIVSEAAMVGKLPVAIWQYADTDGADEDLWCVLPYMTFCRLLAEHYDLYTTLEALTEGPPEDFEDA